VLFVGLNVQGSNNNLAHCGDGREHRARMDAVLAWLQDSLRLARARDLAGILIFAQADRIQGKSGASATGSRNFATPCATSL